MKYNIYAALADEAKNGWIWVPSSAAVTSDFVKITNQEAQHTVVCERRCLDKNYMVLYNRRKRTNSITNMNESLIINEHYRNKLGSIPKNVAVELEIEECKGFVDKYLRAPFAHPSAYVRIGIELGIVSVFLGGLGFILGLAAIIIELISLF